MHDTDFLLCHCQSLKGAPPGSLFQTHIWDLDSKCSLSGGNTEQVVLISADCMLPRPNNRFPGHYAPMEEGQDNGTFWDLYVFRKKVLGRGCLA